MESVSVQRPECLLPIEALRGLNMILMAIDHANFFDILHLYIFAIIGLIFASRGGSGLAAMYPIWLLGLLFLFSLCLRYGAFKKKKSD